MPNITSFIKVGILTGIMLLTGCATANRVDGVNDPLESYNRAMYSINDAVDRAVIKPVATGYDTVVPTGISQGVSNFFSNLNDITVILNDLLQLKFGQALDDTGRFALNTTVGFGGILDVATLAGHEKNNEDFGQTLGAWGVQPGPYVVLPFFGPRNFRDTFGLVGDMYTDPVSHIDDAATRNAIVATHVIDSRANNLSIKKVLDEAALDEYSYVRNAYSQHRQNLVYDGNPPKDDFDVFAD
ncbi:MAG: VacJ family lipoprotein [Pseudomonadota bacterium]|nr:VacJ family lipoprotein [Pseudomonadota bacterium]MDO7710862.1 VacJ family lipoprotein [Pseudomonadota bacterium]